jgi:hypothetical protein
MVIWIKNDLWQGVSKCAQSVFCCSLFLYWPYRPTSFAQFGVPITQAFEQRACSRRQAALKSSDEPFSYKNGTSHTPSSPARDSVN